MTRPVLWLLLVLSLCAAGWAAGTGATATPDHVALSWTGDTATTMTVSWRTDTGVTAGRVQYQDAAAPTAVEVTATASDFSTDLGKARLFSATLTDLTPATAYNYRVGDGKRWSAVRTFTTGDAEARSVKFLVFGDSQSVLTSKGYPVWQKTVQHAYTTNPEARFMVSVGDLVDTGTSGAQWNAWFAGAAGVIDSIPVAPVVGNHECYLGGGKLGRPSAMMAQFRPPRNGPEGLEGQAYSFDYGPVHIAVLDSQAGEERKAAGDILAPQKAWLDADLAASTATWKFVAFHRSPYGLRAGEANPAIKAAFSPIIEKYHVDVVFSGHDHGVGRTFPIKGGKYMADPAQGTVYYLTGRSGTKTYPDVKAQPWSAFARNTLDQPNHVVVDVADTVLTITAVKVDGTVIDTYTIEK